MTLEVITTTVHGLEVKFHCKKGFVPRNEVTAVCLFDDRAWFPDPNEYECNRSDYEVTKPNGEKILAMFPKYFAMTLCYCQYILCPQILRDMYSSCKFANSN